MKGKIISKSGPTIFQQIVIPFVITSFIVITILQISNYFSQRYLITNELKSRFSNSLAVAAAYFDTTYTLPIKNDLKFIQNSYAFNYFLSSQKNEVLLTKPLAEQLFLHFTNRDKGIYLSLRFIDTMGVEKVVTEGNKRGKKYVSLTAVPKDALYDRIFVLFSKLKSEKPGAILCEGPFEYRGKYTFLAGIVKSEPEIGGAAGAVIFHCDLTEYFTHLAGYEFYGERVATIVSLDNKLIFSPIGNDAVINFRKDSTEKEEYHDFYNLAKGIKMGSNSQALFNVVFRISPKIFQRETKKALTYSLLFLLLAIFFISVMVLFVSKKFSRPVVVLINSIKQLAQGDLSARTNIKTTGEIQMLAETFNQMAEDINKTTVSRDSLIKEIAERKQVEAQLCIAEEKYRMQFEGALDAIFVADAETGILIDCNPAAAELVGREKSELLGQHQRILHPQEIIEGEFSNTFKQHLKGEKGKVLETQVITKKGEMKDVAIKVNLFEVRNKKLLQGVFRDITERRRYEERLARVNNCLLNFGPDPLNNIQNLTNVCGEILGGACSLYNRLEGGLLCSRGQWNVPFDYNSVDKPDGHICYDVIKQGGAQPFIARNLPQTSYAQTDPNVTKYKLQTYMGMVVKCAGNPIGSICVVYQNDFVPSEDDKKFLGIIASAIGVEEGRKRAEEQLKTTQSQLVQSAKMASLGLLAGGVAHEINNPLTGVLNNVQLIKMIIESKKDFNLADFKELLTVIEESAIRCTKISHSLLEFSRSPQGAFKEVSPYDIIERVFTLVEHELKLQNIIIQKEVTPVGSIKVLGDSQLLQQVIFNIIHNAKWAIQKKLGKDGGTITIKTEHDAGNNRIFIYIQDTGTGIPKENLEKVFEPFFTTKELGEGTGLGLSIAYKIIKQHNGNIEVESEVYKGTTFKITLPVV